MSEAWTIGRLLAWTTDYLKQHGSETPRLDAEVLLAAARGCQRIQLYTAFDELADDATREKFRGFVRRRAEGAPVAYLVGYREFYSLRFRVTPAVLIPRPETELLVVRLLDLAKERTPAGGSVEIADVGTGSGIIAVCAAKHLPDSRITAIDISAEAIEVARSNAMDHGVGDRIEFINGDLLDCVGDRQFDFIVNNPPYVSAAEFEQLPATVRNFEPRHALLAGPRGTEIIQRLVPQAVDRLNSAGWLLVEISPMIEAAAREILTTQSGLSAQPSLKDLAGLPRILQAQRRG